MSALDLGATSRCRLCDQPIIYAEVVEPGHLPRIGWTDGFPRDGLVCFSAFNLTHAPEATS